MTPLAQRLDLLRDRAQQFAVDRLYLTPQAVTLLTLVTDLIECVQQVEAKQAEIEKQIDLALAPLLKQIEAAEELKEVAEFAREMQSCLPGKSQHPLVVQARNALGHYEQTKKGQLQ